MQCPVPGCWNTELEDHQPFCPGCGLLNKSFQDARYYVYLWTLARDNFQTLLHYVQKNCLREWGNVFEELAQGEGKTFRELCNLKGVPIPKECIDDEEVLSERITFYGTLALSPLESTSWFRILHPHILFFRCWNCDLKNRPDSRPLLPPSTYAHSTLNDELMVGLRPDYTVRERIKNEPLPLPNNVYSNVDRLRDNLPRGPVTYEMQMQIQQLTQLANQRDAEEYQRRMNDHYRRESEKMNRMASLPERPMATAHSSCPQCGMTFPLVLRPNMDMRYSKRHQFNYQTACDTTEYNLYGCDLTVNEARTADPAFYDLRCHQYMSSCVGNGNVLRLMELMNKHSIEMGDHLEEFIRSTSASLFTT